MIPDVSLARSWVGGGLDSAHSAPLPCTYAWHVLFSVEAVDSAVPIVLICKLLLAGRPYTSVAPQMGRWMPGGSVCSRAGGAVAVVEGLQSSGCSGRSPPFPGIGSPTFEAVRLQGREKESKVLWHFILALYHHVLPGGRRAQRGAGRQGPGRDGSVCQGRCGTRSQGWCSREAQTSLLEPSRPFVLPFPSPRASPGLSPLGDQPALWGQGV